MYGSIVDINHQNNFLYFSIGLQFKELHFFDIKSA